MKLSSPPERHRLSRVCLALLVLATLGACGRKGDVTDLLPPPPPPAPQQTPGSGG